MTNLLSTHQTQGIIQDALSHTTLHNAPKEKRNGHLNL